MGLNRVDHRVALEAAQQHQLPRPNEQLVTVWGIGIFETSISLTQGVAGGSSDGAAAPAGAAGVAAGGSFGGSGKAVRPRGGDGAARRRLGAAPPPHAPAAGGAPLTYGPHCQTLPALDEMTAQAVHFRPLTRIRFRLTRVRFRLTRVRFRLPGVRTQLSVWRLCRGRYAAF